MLQPTLLSYVSEDVNRDLSRLQCKYRKRRIWALPKQTDINPECPEVIYYLTPPGSYVLQVVVCTENVARAVEGEGNSSKASCAATTPLKGLKTPRLEVLEEYSTTVSAHADSRKPGLKIPSMFFLGRTYQSLDNVPLEARRWFSRKHCCINWKQNGLSLGEAAFSVIDLGSANGTYVNGRVLQRRSSRNLKSGDLIGVSMTESDGLMLGFRFIVQHVAARVRVEPSPLINALSTQVANTFNFNPYFPEESKCLCLDCELDRDPLDNGFDIRKSDSLSLLDSEESERDQLDEIVSPDQAQIATARKKNWKASISNSMLLAKAKLNSKSIICLNEEPSTCLEDNRLNEEHSWFSNTNFISDQINAKRAKRLNSRRRLFSTSPQAGQIYEGIRFSYKHIPLLRSRDGIKQLNKKRHESVVKTCWVKTSKQLEEKAKAENENSVSLTLAHPKELLVHVIGMNDTNFQPKEKVSKAKPIFPKAAYGYDRLRKLHRKANMSHEVNGKLESHKPTPNNTQGGLFQNSGPQTARAVLKSATEEYHERTNDLAPEIQTIESSINTSSNLIPSTFFSGVVRKLNINRRRTSMPETTKAPVIP